MGIFQCHVSFQGGDLFVVAIRAHEGRFGGAKLGLKTDVAQPPEPTTRFVQLRIEHIPQSRDDVAVEHLGAVEKG